MSRSASVSVSGVSRAAWSASTSAATPPSPNTTSGPEHVVVGHPDDHLGAARDHRLDQDLALALAEPAGQPAVGGPHVGLGAQVELDRARVGLVHEPGHVGLEHHRAARRLERADRLVLAPGRGELGQRDAVAAQQFGGPLRRHPAAAERGVQEPAHQRAGVLGADVREAGHLAARLGAPRPVPGRAGHGGGRRLRVGVGGDLAVTVRARDQPDRFRLAERRRRRAGHGRRPAGWPRSGRRWRRSAAPPRSSRPPRRPPRAAPGTAGSSRPEIAVVVSTGPATVPTAGSSARSRRLVSPCGRWTVRPRSVQASAASAPAPPTLDTIATVRPAGTGWAASSAAVSTSARRWAWR